MQQEKQLCIYCGIRPAIENEHVIGNVFYIQRPKKAITVPSCSACSRGRGDGGVCDLHLDEEYMRTILCMAEGCANHPVVIALLEGNIARSFRRRHRGLRQRLLRSIQRTERMSTDGVFQPYSSPFVRPDFSRFQRVLRKITKGLYYHIRENPLPSDYQVLVNPVIKPREVPILIEKLQAKGDPSESAGEIRLPTSTARRTLGGCETPAIYGEQRRSPHATLCSKAHSDGSREIPV
jgi:hypothetical protein